MTFSVIEQLVLATLICIAITSFSVELLKRYKIIMKGTGSFSFSDPHIRIKRVLEEFVLQKKVLSQRFWPGLMHALVFWGFMVFGIITLDHFLSGFNIHFFDHDIKLIYAKFFGVPWAIFVIIG